MLAYVTSEEDAINQGTTKKGPSRRQKAVQPEMRIIDIKSKREVSVADTLEVSRFESLSATDYHLGVLPAIRLARTTQNQRGTLEAIGGGIEAIGGGIWDATMYPAKLFSSTASVRSVDTAATPQGGKEIDPIAEPKGAQQQESPDPLILTHGMKIFIQSPYDTILATKPTLSDHFSWLTDHAKYEEAWNLLDNHPEATCNRVPSTPESSPSTPGYNGLRNFFADDNSLLLPSENLSARQRAEKEKLHVGEQWVQQLVSLGDWSNAGRVCGQVLETSSAWEYWVLVFEKDHRHDEITPFVPGPEQITLKPLIYEHLLGHYISADRTRFCELLQRWPPSYFAADTIVEDGIAGRDWSLLMESLARLYLAVGRPRKALRCYIKLQDAEAAMNLISDAHLVEAVADDVPGFILLRVSRDQQRNASLAELEDLTLDPIRLLVSEAHHGVVLPETVIYQLDHRYGLPNPYLYFYFRALWHGETAEDTVANESNSLFRTPKEERLLAQEGKSLVSDHGDTAVTLFAEYDRPLLMTFLKSSQSYTLSSASTICEQRHYIPELVYLLSKEGRISQALRLIIDELGDVRQAIQFAKEQDDPSLWDELIEESMDQPDFIRGLLEESGTSIDPLKLIQRIPPGLEIEGLKEGLQRMLREFEVQESISKGAARVFRGEINEASQTRSQGLRKGIKFSVAGHAKKRQSGGGVGKDGVKPKDIKPGHCAGCGKPINEHGMYALPACCLVHLLLFPSPSFTPRLTLFPTDSIRSYLLAFPCTHTFHLRCILKHTFPPGTEVPSMLDELLEDEEVSEQSFELPKWERSIGPKVDRARLVGTVLRGGGPLEERDGEG